MLLAETFGKHGIRVQQCSDDAETSIVQAALEEARESPVEVRAEDSDILVMLIHHSVANHLKTWKTCDLTSLVSDLLLGA